MIDVLEEIALLYKIRNAAEEKNYAKVLELCDDKIHDNTQAVKKFEDSYAEAKNQ